MRVYRFIDLLHPSSFFICFFSFYILLGLFRLWIGVDGIELNVNTNIAVILYLVTFFVSSFITTPLIFNYKPKFYTSFIYDLDTSRVQICFFILLGLGVSFHLFYFLQLGYIPALHEHAAMVRVTAKKGFGGGLLLATGAIYAAFILLSCIFLKLSKFKKFFFTFLLFSSSLLISFVGFRGPAAYLLLLMVLAVYFSSCYYINLRAIPKSIILFGLLFIILLSVVDYMRYGNALSIDAFTHTLWTVTVNVFNLNAIVTGVDSNQIPLFYGYSFVSDLAVALPSVESEFLGVKLVSMLGLSFVGEGMTVTAPGEGYVNFGFVGVFLHAFILGMVSEMVYKYLIQGSNISSLGLLAFTSMAIAKISVAGIMPTLIFTIVPVLIFLMPVLIWSRK